MHPAARTHSDANGLAAFPLGITIIGHENNKKEQETALAAGGRGAPPPDHLPVQVVTDSKENLKIDGEKLEVLHPDPLIHLEKNGLARLASACGAGMTP